jgi:hypothetical protein
MALAGTLAIAATAVYAQVNSVVLKAAIPFSFQVGSQKVMQGGDYRISHSGNGANCTLRTIHAGNGKAGAYWPSPKGKAEGGEVAQIIVVPVTVTAE